MPISKQDYYEGAALHAIVRAVEEMKIRYAAPLYILNDCRAIYFKYSTRCRSPWSFTFTQQEQIFLRDASKDHNLIISLICGSDSVAVLSYLEFIEVASLRETSIHIGCFRRHREHFSIKGPDGILSHKIAPSDWKKIMKLEHV